jgi:hypothetical protein
MLVCYVCRLKLLPAAPWQLDGKSAAKLNQSYSLQPKVLPLLQQHDELCDLLSQLALEVKQAVAVDRDIEAKVGSAGLWLVCAKCSVGLLGLQQAAS